MIKIIIAVALVITGVTYFGYEHVLKDAAEAVKEATVDQIEEM